MGALVDTTPLVKEWEQSTIRFDQMDSAVDGRCTQPDSIPPPSPSQNRHLCGRVNAAEISHMVAFSRSTNVREIMAIGPYEITRTTFNGTTTRGRYEVLQITTPNGTGREGAKHPPGQARTTRARKQGPSSASGGITGLRTATLSSSAPSTPNTAPNPQAHAISPWPRY